MAVTNHTGEKERGEEEEERDREQRGKERRKREKREREGRGRKSDREQRGEEERTKENKINKSHNYKLLNTNSIFNPFNFNPFITHFTLLHLRPTTQRLIPISLETPPTTSNKKSVRTKDINKGSGQQKIGQIIMKHFATKIKKRQSAIERLDTDKLVIGFTKPADNHTVGGVA